MKVTTEKLEGEVQLNIELEPDEVERAKDRAYRRLVNRYVIPGFRRGKAPRPMLERFVGPSVLLNEAINNLVPELYDQAVQEHDIQAIAEPKMEITSYDPVTVKATVPVRPTVELADYQTIRVAPEPVEVTAQQIDQALEQIRLQRAHWEPVERPVEMGDNAIIDLKGSVDGRQVTDQSGMSYLVRPGSEQPVPGFAEALVGTEVGQEKEIRLAFPADHANPRLAGREYVFEVKVERVEGRQLPEVDDEFAQKLGMPNVDSAEKLRDYLRDALQREAEGAARANLEEKVLSTVVAASQVEFSPLLVDQQVDFYVQGRAWQLKQQGIDFEQWLRYLGKTEEQIRDEVRPESRQMVARELVLQKVIEQEGIEPDEAEIAHQMEHARQENRENVDREAIARQLRRVKAVRRLVEIATEGAVTYPALVGEAAAAGAGESAGIVDESEGAGQPDEGSETTAGGGEAAASPDE